MSGVIRDKLQWVPGTQSTTTLTFLAVQQYANIIKESEFILRLEMVACDGNCASLRPSEVALVLLCTYLDAAVNRLNANADATVSADGPSSHNASTIASSYQMLKDELMQFAMGLQEKCNISEESFCSTHGAVVFYVRSTISDLCYPSSRNMCRLSRFERLWSGFQC
ncbi:Cyclin-G2 [Temnothorax longispinosus]|uniref:Cyclin-G2 n=1 Tax=Temnothorax longispinosus TaxID=300112 RepID=A0A4S2KID6_9HYME|nr:Cyclin-G2 [Temnothorax longispinosus]